MDPLFSPGLRSACCAMSYRGYLIESNGVVAPLARRRPGGGQPISCEAPEPDETATLEVSVVAEHLYPAVRSPDGGNSRVLPAEVPPRADRTLSGMVWRGIPSSGKSQPSRLSP